ncbi:MAG TPA: oligosaccharide flippase family protein [Acidimicrobiia bacterium]|nr:oligosaccharide flippase family protein [Acidimicrobiia bacterium]
MQSVKSNIRANFIGRLWTALMYFAFVPVYIRFIGVEGYGLIGFFVALVGVTSALDLGLSAALNRELARRVALGAEQDSRNLVRTFEAVYWGVGIILGSAIALLAGPISRNWLRSVSMDTQTVQRAVLLMGLVLAVQWPLVLYQGGLRGLERQVSLNVVTMIFATVRAGGAALVLWLVTPSIEAFFAWHLGAAALHTISLSTLLWHHLPGEGRGRFDPSQFVGVRGFAAGLAAISMLALVFTQLDKVILSRMIDLDEFGYYSLATVVAGGLAYVVLPIFEAVFPRFSALVADGGEPAALVGLYHRASQLVTILLLPAALGAAFFASELIWVWTGSLDAAATAGPLLTLLVIGSALNGLVNVPYALMLANGWTRLPLFLNLGAVVLLLPLLLILVNRYGAVGAAVIWSTVNVGYLLVGVTALHRKYLTEELNRWALSDVLVPGIAAAVVVVLARLGTPAVESRLLAAGWLVGTVATSMLTAALATDMGRHLLRSLIQRQGPGNLFKVNA